MSRKTWPVLFTTLSLAILLAGCGTGCPAVPVTATAAAAPSPVRDARFDSVRAHIQRLVNDGGAPSIAVAVAKDGQILWEEGFGLANCERGIAATAHTPYSIASINKAITSTAIMILSERGDIDIDAPLDDYLGGIRFSGIAGDRRNVTPRLAMAHSAGLPQRFRTVYAGDEMPTAEQTLTRYGMVVFPPGEYFHYSNVGYRSLDVAIANVSGQSYGEFLRREVFVPLGMTRSALDLHPSWSAEAATRYGPRQQPIRHYVTDHPGSGDVFASAHDLMRFGMFHIGTPLPDQRPVLRPESIAEMQRVNSAPGQNWGLGWELTGDRGHRVVAHGGGQPGVNTQLALYPDAGLVVVILSNRSGGDAYDISRRIAAVVLPNEGTGALPPPASPSATVSLSDLTGTWAGTLTTYEREEPFVLIFHPYGDVHVRVGGRMTSLVNDVSASDVVRGSFHGLMNTSDAMGHHHTLHLTLLPRGGELVGELMALVTEPLLVLTSAVRVARVDAARLDEYAGVYRHGEGDLRMITRQGDQLYSQRTGGRRFALDPVGEDAFVLVGTAGTALRFLRENGRVVEAELVPSGGVGSRARRVEGEAAGR
jgi:CubicO group peptidase (beta-lactamase class C family)